MSASPDEVRLFPFVTPPLLLLGLYLGLLILALLLCGWAGHTRPTPEESRRVTDAVERAALEHLKTPARIATLAVVLLSSLFAAGAYFVRAESGAWYLGACTLGSLVVVASLLYAVRKALRASGQMAGAQGADLLARISSRNAVGVVLFLESTLGLLFLSLHSLVAFGHGVQLAGKVVLALGATVSVVALVFARAATSAILSTSDVTSPSDEPPHPASLAVLVATTYHAPLLRLLGLVALSIMGQTALLFSGSGTVDSSVAIYPHVLKLLGLFGLLFSGLVVRMTDEEEPSAGWIRGSLVYLVLMIAGAWSLSTELPDHWARVVPAGLTFFYVALGVTAWSSSGSNSARSQETSFPRAFRAWAPQGLSLLSLAVVLLISSATLPEENAVPAPVLLHLVLAGALSGAPFSVVWLLAGDLSEGGTRTEHLAYPEQGTLKGPRPEPSGPMLRMFPLLCAFVLLMALSCQLVARGELEELSLAILCLSALVGALGLSVALGFLDSGAKTIATRIAGLIRTNTDASQDVVDFEKAVLYSAQSIAHREWAFVGFCLLPSVFLAAVLPVVPLPLGRALLLGLGLGCTGLGVLFALVTSAGEGPRLRSLGALALLLSLFQAIWLLTLGGLPAPPA